jgi:hypothetical protein
MPYYCSCKDKEGNTLSSTVLAKGVPGTDCLDLQQVQFRIYEAAPRMTVLNWTQTFTLTPEQPVRLCRAGAPHTAKGPWSSITETLMEVTTVKPYGDVSTTLHKDGTISFDRVDVAGRCDGQCPLTFTSVTQPVTAIQPFKTTT